MRCLFIFLCWIGAMTAQAQDCSPIFTLKFPEGVAYLPRPPKEGEKLPPARWFIWLVSSEYLAEMPATLSHSETSEEVWAFSLLLCSVWEKKKHRRDEPVLRRTYCVISAEEWAGNKPREGMLCTISFAFPASPAPSTQYLPLAYQTGRQVFYQFDRNFACKVKSRPLPIKKAP